MDVDTRHADYIARVDDCLAALDVPNPVWRTGPEFMFTRMAQREGWPVEAVAEALRCHRAAAPRLESFYDGALFACWQLA